MYATFLKLILIATLLELGISATALVECGTGDCLKSLQSATHNVLHVEWKPISVFPEEAARFQTQSEARRSASFQNSKKSSHRDRIFKGKTQ